MAEILVDIDVGELDDAVRFHTEALGLRLRRRLGAEVAELAGASARAFLTRHESGTRPVAGSPAIRGYERHWTPVHLDFVVEDLEAAVQTARAAGARPEGEVHAFAWGRYQVPSDPFGNGFCLLAFRGAGYAALA